MTVLRLLRKFYLFGVLFVVLVDLEGVLCGFIGIVRKPMIGAKAEGLAGLLTGIGKGLVGAVTTPVSGLFDFVSGSFQSTMRVADMSAEIRRLRNPRMFYIDKIIRPFNIHKAAGCMILKLIKEGIFALTDQYVAHALIRGDGRVLIVTDKRIIHATCLTDSGHWDAEWSFTWDEIEDTHQIYITIEIVLKKKLFPSFTHIERITLPKLVHIIDAETAEYIHGKIEQLLKRQT